MPSSTPRRFSLFEAASLRPSLALSIAGLPLYYTDQSPLHADGESGHRGQGPRVSISPGLRPWQTPTIEHINAIADFHQTMGLSVMGVAWSGPRLVISIHMLSDSDLSRLPWAIDHLAVSYDSHVPFQGPESACRGIQPGENEVDDSNYGSQLRPGVMLSSGPASTGELLTTSGLPLRSSSGEIRVGRVPRIPSP